MALDPWPAALLRFGILLALAAPFAPLLRRGGLPGGRPAAAILAGVLVGLLAGPLVLGAVQPEFHRALTIGATAERAELLDLRRQHQAEVAVMAETGVSEQAITERRAEQEQELEPLLVSQRAALAEHAFPARFVATALVTLAFFAGSAVARRRKPRLEVMPEVVPAIASGAMAALTAILAHAALAVWLLDAPQASAFAIGAAFGAGSVAPHVPMRWIGFEGRRLPASGMMVFMFLVGVITLIVAVGDPASSWLLPPALATFIGGFARREWAGRRRVRDLARAVLLLLVVAPVTAWAVSLTDPRLLLDSWRPAMFAILVILLAGTPHLLGVYLTIKLLGPPRQRARAISTGIEAMALGLSFTQVLFLVLLVACGELDPGTPVGVAVVWGLVLAALSFELSLSLLRRMIRTEQRLLEELD